MNDSELTRRRVTALLGSGVVAGIAGCTGGTAVGQEGDDTTTTTTTTTAGGGSETTEGMPTDMEIETTNNPCEAVQEGNAAIRFAHLSPDAPTTDIDLGLDGVPVLDGVPFGTITPYLVLPAETFHVSVSPTAGDSPVFEGDLGLDAQAYTIAALGEVADQNQSLTVKRYVDSVYAPPSGQSRVRLVHAAPDAPAVDVTVEGADVTLFDDVAFGQASDYATVDAGDYTTEIRPATETDDGTVVTTIATTLPAGAVVTVFAVGYLSPDGAPASEPFRVLPVVDDPG